MLNIFILALDHSRSTIIDIEISRRLGGISLGEVRRTINPSDSERTNIHNCTCSKDYENCELWQQINQTGYAKYLENSDKPIIDSSKDIRHYFTYKNDLDETVILYRKFSSWHKSAIESLKREGRYKNRGKIKNKSDLRLFLRTYKLIAFIEFILTLIRFVYASNFRYTVISSYSDFLDFIRIQEKHLPINIRKQEVHMIRGNRILHQWKTIRLNQFNESDLISRILKTLSSK